MHLLRHVERWFWAVCVVAVLAGLLAPLAFPRLALVGNTWCLRTFLGGILFFTGLKIDFSAAWQEFRRPWVVLLMAVVRLGVMPLLVWLAARQLIPDYALGVLIVAAMPAGMAGSSLTQIARGNAALALVGILVTSLLCPLAAPLVIGVGTGREAGESLRFLAGQSGYLAVILFVPTAAAFLVRRGCTAWVERHREGFTGLSILSLSLLIFGIMASMSRDFWALARAHPGQAAGLFAFMCGFSVAMHLAGYFLAPWRPAADRAAVSVNMAYVNNGLAAVFARDFFKDDFGVGAVVPAIFLEIPMVLAILVLKAWLERRSLKETPPR